MNKTQFNVIGKLPTKPNNFNFGFKLGKEGDREKTLSEGEISLSRAEQTLRWYIKKGCTDCRIEEIAELIKDNTVSVSLSEIF